MKKRLLLAASATIVALLSFATPALAHRLDEYLQATTITVARDRIHVRLRLVAGVVAAPKVIAMIDANGDGIFSDTERHNYAERVRNDVSLGVAGHDAPLTLVSSSFPSMADMRQGLGDIVLELDASVSSGDGAHRLTFENHHERAMAAYLVNTLVPDDSTIHILSQDRARDQSTYQLAFGVGTATTLANASVTSLTHDDDAAVVTTYFWHGVRHILTGFDHLLFLAALVLGAASLWGLVKVVTAFTIAHSMTLTLAALNLVHLPSAVVEPLIAASIVFVAVQNIFWPDRAHGKSRLAVAFFFGLFHGLGFAGGLLEIMHQMPHTMILLAILGFSLGVEAGNQVVLLPLYGVLKTIRRARARASTGSMFVPLQRIGSAAVSVAGVYYLCVALIGG